MRFKDNDTEVATLVNTTWEQLVQLRNSNKLAPGSWYRITDYITKVANDDEARSAGHPFDILVLSTGPGNLSEEARAIASDRDTDGYFADANIDAWKLWYCIDNDTTRFAWADSANGKGVIWRMIDEWNNDIPYDFKNVQFKRYPYTAVNLDLEEGSRYNAVKSEDFDLDVDFDDYSWCYTFNIITDEGNVDMSVFAGTSELFDYAKRSFGNNLIKPFTCAQIIDDESSRMNILNNIVLYNHSEISKNLPCNNVIDSECYNFSFVTSCGNKIDSDNINIIAGINFNYNTIGAGGSCNLFGDNCFHNRFATSFYSNVLGNDCLYNTFGNYCCYNTFGNNCDNNTFGNNYFSNTFGNNCDSNTFGNNFKYNTFGNNCGSNTFGNDCDSNTFGNSCFSNTFGNYCKSNSFGDCFVKSTVFDNVTDVEVDDSQYSSQIQNVQILNGTSGSDSTHKLALNFAKGKNYTQIAAKKTGGTLRIWNPADIE